MDLGKFDSISSETYFPTMDDFCNFSFKSAIGEKRYPEKVKFSVWDVDLSDALPLSHSVI